MDRSTVKTEYLSVINNISEREAKPYNFLRDDDQVEQIVSQVKEPIFLFRKRENMMLKSLAFEKYEYLEKVRVNQRNKEQMMRDKNKSIEYHDFNVGQSGVLYLKQSKNVSPDHAKTSFGNLEERMAQALDDGSEFQPANAKEQFDTAAFHYHYLTAHREGIYRRKSQVKARAEEARRRALIKKDDRQFIKFIDEKNQEVEVLDDPENRLLLNLAEGKDLQGIMDNERRKWIKRVKRMRKLKKLKRNMSVSTTSSSSEDENTLSATGGSKKHKKKAPYALPGTTTNLSNPPSDNINIKDWGSKRANTLESKLESNTTITRY